MGELDREWTFTEGYLLRDCTFCCFRRWAGALQGLYLMLQHCLHFEAATSVLCSEVKRNVQGCVWEGYICRSKVELCEVIESPSIA